MTAGWDAHAHVIGDPARFPFISDRAYTPAPAPLEDYLATLDRCGAACGVLVQPSVYGFDNACLLDALDRAGGRLRGIVVPAPEATARDFEAMHRRGVRGVRCNPLNPGGLPFDVVARWRDVLGALGWHVELHVEIARVPDLPALIARFGVPVVVDHMGRLTAGQLDPSSAPASELIALARAGACFVKLSAPYRFSAAPPPWHDVVPLARAFVEANPRACVWGTDWPHVHTTAPVRTDDVIDALTAWCPDPAVRQRVTSAAARRLYQ